MVDVRKPRVERVLEIRHHQDDAANDTAVADEQSAADIVVHAGVPRAGEVGAGLVAVNDIGDSGVVEPAVPSEPVEDQAPGDEPVAEVPRIEWVSATEASQLTGTPKTTLLRAIKGGRIVARKGKGGRWRIDRASLVRVFPAKEEETADAAPAPVDPVAADLGAVDPPLVDLGAVNTEAAEPQTNEIPETVQADVSSLGPDRLTLEEAAARTGKSVPIMRRTIAVGRLAAVEEDDGTWTVDGAELSQVYPTAESKTPSDAGEPSPTPAPMPMDVADLPSAGTATGSDGRPLEDDLRAFLLVLRHRWLVVVATMVVFLAATFIVLPMLPEKYTAQALIQINPANNIVDIQSVVSALSNESSAVRGEAQALRSRQLARATIAATDLINHPALTEKKGFGSGLLSGLFGGSSESSGVSGEDYLPGVAGGVSPGSGLPVEAVDDFLQVLRIAPVRESNVLAVRYGTRDPVLAALVVNTLVDLYIDEQLQVKDSAARQASDAITERLAALKAEAEQSEQEIERFRSQMGLIDGVDGPLLKEQVSRVSQELALARSGLLEARARMSEIRQRADGEDIGYIAEVLNSPAIRLLRDREVQLAQRRAQASEDFGPRHPVMQAIVAEQAEVQTEMAREVDRVVDNLNAELRISEVRVGALEKELVALEQKAVEANRAGVLIRTLERDAEASRTLYQTFLGRSKETAAQDGLSQADARIISYADAPANPSQPKKKLILALAMFASGMLGVALAFVVDRLDNVGFRSSDQIERTTGHSVLGLIPALGRRGRKDPVRYMQKRPHSEYSESIRGIQTSILLAEQQQRPKTLAVVSALPAEGKTTLSISLARMLASTQRRIVLVDCDMRRARVHKRVGIDNSKGLSDYLASDAGELPLREIMFDDPASNAIVIPAGSGEGDSADLLQSKKMTDLLDTLREEFEFVILDAPPILPIADGRVVCAAADAALFLIRWRKTPRDAAIGAIKQLREAGVSLAGCVMTQVDLKQYAHYGYGAAYYGDAYRQYFSE